MTRGERINAFIYPEHWRSSLFGLFVDVDVVVDDDDDDDDDDDVIVFDDDDDDDDDVVVLMMVLSFLVLVAVEVVLMLFFLWFSTIADDGSVFALFFDMFHGLSTGLQFSVPYWMCSTVPYSLTLQVLLCQLTGSTVPLNRFYCPT